MDEEILKKAKDCLKSFGVKLKGDIVYLYPKGNKYMWKLKPEWKLFIGLSVNELAEMIAEELGKEVKYEN